MTNKYGSFTKFQIKNFKKRINKSIFLLLISVDPNTQDSCEHINTEKVFNNLLLELGGASSVLFEPPEIVEAVNLLEKAHQLYESDNFNFQIYRKCILDAGGCISRIEEV